MTVAEWRGHFLRQHTELNKASRKLPGDMKSHSKLKENVTKFDLIKGKLRVAQACYGRMKWYVCIECRPNTIYRHSHCSKITSHVKVLC
jgi:hypothetical protein